MVGDGADLGLTLRYSWEQPVLGSAGGPRHALPLLDGDPYLLLNGDTLATVDLRALWDHHHAHDALVTMALIPNPEPARFGGVLVDADGWITGFCRRGDPRPSYHFFSAQVVARSVFADLPDGVKDESVARLYPLIIAASPRRLRAFICDGTVHRGRDAGRLPPGARTAGGGGRRVAMDSQVRAPPSIRRRVSIARSCGTMWRSAPVPCSSAASSPIVSAYPTACTSPMPAWCRGPTATALRPGERRAADVPDRSRRALTIAMPTLQLPDAKDRVAHYLDALGDPARGARVVGLTGDASDRKYYRVLPKEGDPFVLAVHASAIDAESLPFVNVGRLLEAMPVPTPRLLGYDNALGILSLQDLGDVTLQAHLGTQPFPAHAALYRQAVAHIVTMQTRGAVLTSPAYLPYGIAFDVDKLTWELDFFLKHYLLAYRNAMLTPAEIEAVRAEFKIIVEELAGEPRVLCHRDYHSRNLMLSQGQLYLIDFQDARMGPDTYDLASLLRDSYVDLNDIAINELIAYFLALKGGSVPRGRLPGPLRSDGAAAQPEGDGHVRLPDDHPPESGLHPVHAADAALRRRHTAAVPAIRPAPRAAAAAHRRIAMTIMATYIEDIAAHVGETVTLKGWLHNRRSSGKLHFLTVRDGTGFIQAVMSKAAVGPEVFVSADHLGQESAIIVSGAVRADARAPGGYELDVSGFEVVSQSHDYPITPKEHGVDYLMDRRHLWIRAPRQQAILRVRHEVIDACRDFFNSRGFILADTPIFTPSACEGTTTLFPVQYFEDTTAYLTQSGQLYNEANAMALGRVYAFGPTFRAEKSKTRRHLTEFWMVEPEMAYASLDDTMDLAEDLIVSVVSRVLDKRARELKALERDTAKLEAVQRPFPRITYDDAVDKLRAAGQPFEWGGDFGGTDETVISQQFDRPVCINRYPSAIKAFYMKPDPARPEVALGVDVIAPEGYGEIIGGGERLADYDLLLQRIEEHKLPKEAFDWYLDLRRYGSVPHAGFGMGIERCVSWICGLEHVRETIPYPRMLYRLYP